MPRKKTRKKKRKPKLKKNHNVPFGAITGLHGQYGISTLRRKKKRKKAKKR